MLKLTSFLSLVDCDGAVGGSSLKSSTVATKGTTLMMNSMSIRLLMPVTLKLSSSSAVLRIFKHALHKISKKLQC